jgi:hypothetical protein
MPPLGLLYLGDEKEIEKDQSASERIQNKLLTSDNGH